jgi:SAM-dependent methyltransferase
MNSVHQVLRVRHHECSLAARGSMSARERGSSKAQQHARGSGSEKGAEKDNRCAISTCCAAREPFAPEAQRWLSLAGASGGVSYDARSRQALDKGFELQTHEVLPRRAKSSLPARLFVPLALLFLIGALSTSLWIGAVQFPFLRDRPLSTAMLASALICVALTSINLMARWLRWHFLIRRFSSQLVTRDSLAVYVATLPALMTPFLLGELARVWLLRKRFRGPALRLVRVWLAERALDAGVLATGLAFSFGTAAGLLASGALALFALLLFGGVLRGPSWRSVSGVALASSAATIFAWALPVAALHLSLQLLGSSTSTATALRAFSASTLAGAATGLPLGVFVTGSAMIRELLHAGVPARVAVLTILVYRAGTAWYAVLLGFASWLMFRERLSRLLRGETDSHFDELADDYAGEIAAHVRDRLLQRKVALMDQTLARYGIARGARGLDLGCGQGWYLRQMLELGYRMDGTDYSAGQLERARREFEPTESAPALVQADAQALPFDNDTYDFVYSINALHHILGPGAQLRALREAVRVLKPGGVLLLHEINTHNPIFRWYMGYLFPLLKRIDEGTEEWLRPSALPPVTSAHWSMEDVSYFTFLPDFAPAKLLDLFAGLERCLERSRFKIFSAHYQACLVKLRTEPARPSSPAVEDIPGGRTVEAKRSR